MRPAANPVVIVEDDPLDVELLADHLAALEIASPIVVCEDGAEALALLKPMAELGHVPCRPVPHAIFIDLKLPKIDGLAVIRWIRQQPRLGGVLVVVVSASDDPSDATNAFACGADDFIRKPADRAQLESLLVSTPDPAGDDSAAPPGGISSL